MDLIDRFASMHFLLIISCFLSANKFSFRAIILSKRVGLLSVTGSWCLVDSVSIAVVSSVIFVIRLSGVWVGVLVTIVLVLLAIFSRFLFIDTS